MKTLCTIIGILFLATNVFAANEKTVNSKISDVTVFTSSAEVKRTANFSAGSGLTEIIFDGVSPYINSKSIQANGYGSFTILDVQFRVKQPEPIPPQNAPLPPKIVKDIELLNDSIANIGFDIEDLKNKKEYLNLEKNVLLGNKYMQGNVDTITELEFAMDYLRKQLADINTSLMKVKRNIFLLTKKQAAMQLRLSKLQSYNSHVNPPKQESPKYQVVVTINAKAAVKGKMNISYMISNAGWSPTYDIRATNVGKPIQLVCKANVYQNSGEDWENVRLKLSTISPNQNYVKPYLSVLYASFYNHNNPSYKTRGRKRAQSAPMLAGAEIKAMEDADYSEMLDPAYTSADFAQANYTMTNIEYEIDLPYTIPADGQVHLVAIQEQKLDAEYFHYLVPKLDKQAFLIAKISDWGSLDLLPGNANVYFEGTYVGETAINTGIMADTMELALGKDRGVIAERKKAKDKIRNELIGNNIVKTISYTIKIKSNKLAVTNIIIEDQIPLSNTEEIKVEALSYGKANYEKTTGMLTWKYKLPSKQTKSFNFSYSINHNKNKQLANVY